MKSSWQMDTGHLVCRWYEVGQHVRYNPPWMQEASNIQGSDLPPFQILPATVHFGGARGASWFLRYAPNHDSE